MLFCEIVAKYDSWFWSATTDTPLEKTSSRWSVIQAWIFQVGVCLCASLCVHAPVDRTHVLPRHGFEDFHFHVFQYSSVRVKVVLKTLAFQSLRKWPCYKRHSEFVMEVIFKIAFLFSKSVTLWLTQPNLNKLVPCIGDQQFVANIMNANQWVCNKRLWVCKWAIPNTGRSVARYGKSLLSKLRAHSKDSCFRWCC